MTSRKKAGIGEAITGVVFLIAAFLSFRFETDPSWVPAALNIIGLVAGALGFVTVFPDKD